MKKQILLRRELDLELQRAGLSCRQDPGDSGRPLATINDLQRNLFLMLNLMTVSAGRSGSPRAALFTEPKKCCDFPGWRAEERLTYY